MSRISEGDYVVLMDQRGKKWLLRVAKDRVLSLHVGNVNLGELVGKRYGDTVETSAKKSLHILRPTIFDYVMKMQRPTQIVYPKDIGYIILRLGIKPGYKILEVGTGSGAITAALAWVMGNSVRIDTYEKRPDIAEVALKNISKVDKYGVVNLINKDIKEADLPEEEYDAAIIDIDSPWEILEKVHRSLAPGGGICIILPTYNQLDRVLDVAEKYFTNVEAVEIFYRTLQAKKGMVRPEFRMIGYTAVVLTAFKKNIR